MTLPNLDSLVHTHTVTLSNDLSVSFQLRPIPGGEYQTIIDAHRDPDTGKTPFETIAVPVIAASVTSVYSSVESTPSPFTADDAKELWTTWPEWARWDVYTAIIGYTTKGPAGNPFTGSTQKENAEP